MWLLLNDSNVRSVLTMTGAVAEVEEAYRDLADGEAAVGDRVNLMLPNGWMRISPAALYRKGVVGYKEFHEADGHGVRYTINLFRYDSGEMLASMDGTAITIARTGATGGVAVKVMTAAQFEWAAVIGSGVEARAQVGAINEVCPLRGVTVFSPNPASRVRFADLVGQDLGIEVREATSPEEAVADNELIVVATDTGGKGTAFAGAWIPDRPGVHINSIGSTMAAQRELDTDVWGRVGPVVIDSPTLLDESGDAIAAREAGTLDRDRIVDLGAVLTGTHAMDDGGTAPTLFKSVGLAVQDIAVAWGVYSQAVERGIGVWVDDHLTLKP
jgi:alanine dehydrogenase